MVRQDDFPEQWQCDSPQKRVVVEIRVPLDPADNLSEFKSYAVEEYGISLVDVDEDQPPEEQVAQIDRLGGPLTISGFVEDPATAPRLSDVAPLYDWIEIPTSSVEQWVEKGEASEIQRTAKVEFPTEWGTNTSDVRHNSPRRLVAETTAESDDPYLHGRVWMQDRDGDWIIEHHGWIGGVGQTGNASKSKLWIYDFAELLSGVPVGETFTGTSVGQALELVGNLTNDTTPIPMSDVVVIPPETEEEFAQLADELELTGDVFFSSIPEEDFIGGGPGDEQTRTALAYYSVPESNGGPIDVDPNSAQNLPEPDGTTFVFQEAPQGGRVAPTGATAESFEANRDTLVDVYKWFESSSGSTLHFEPTPNSVVLVADVVPSRRIFAQREVIDQQSDLDVGDDNAVFTGDAYTAHQATTVLENDALYELKPLNTLYLRGDTPSGLLHDTKKSIEDGLDKALKGSYQAPSVKFPSVKVKAPELLDAAEGVELSGSVVESNATELDEAKREAKRELASRLEESSEGAIVLAGVPRLRPYDRVDAFEVCQGDIEYEQQPVRYEVESVKHVKTADDIFKTRIKVSIWANDETIEVVDDETGMEEI